MDNNAIMMLPKQPITIAIESSPRILGTKKSAKRTNVRKNAHFNAILPVWRMRFIRAVRIFFFF